MYEILKSIAVANNWVFFYGRRDFENLFEDDEQKNTPHIFLDPVNIRDVDNEIGVTEKKVYTGSFLFVFSSSIDELSYEDRYVKYIKPIIDVDLQKIKTSINCNYAKINNWQTTEVINILDYNFDGVICDFEIEI